MRTREGFRLVQPKIAHAAALGEDHHIMWAALGETDVRYRIAVSGLVALIWRARPKCRHEQLSLDARLIEIAILPDADRPHRISAIIAGSGPFGIAKRIAAPHCIIEAG